ncbi:uncharacterized protein LOC106674283 [Cimex lectularius]|uniref:Uncharacterized protein n=1 Tax=Cimex lectularius TaxID=79782 RepID=A0A8I6SDM5_CIMLE|nr:uncharacterized protein LOC106674283 [Cimex lectularius]XP_014262426.1 uncharacterized protein LOC106674283 [Cimex lectularius]
MKIPFHEQFGTFFRTYNKDLCMICSPCLFGSMEYVLTLSIIGTLTTLWDCVCLTNCGQIYSHLKPIEPNFCPVIKKYFRFLTCGLYLAIYSSLAIGIKIEHPVLLLPYILLQMVNITLLILVAFLSIPKSTKLTRKTLIYCGFSAFNFLQCFCSFRHMLQSRDF